MDAQKQMARMVEAVQPHCDEVVAAAMTCSHAGSMSTTMLSTMMGGTLGPNRTSELPNPVLVAVGSGTVYAFAYKPRGFGFKIKKEVRRWARDDLTVAVEETDRMCYLTMRTGSDDLYPLEVATVMGAKEVVGLFITALAGEAG
jgi:hypothetical protein